MELTKHQQFTLSKIREKDGEWFKSYNLPHVVRRPEHTCRLLRDKGYLEMRYVQGALDPEFRLKEHTDAA